MSSWNEDVPTISGGVPQKIASVKVFGLRAGRDAGRRAPHYAQLQMVYVVRNG